MQTAHSRGVCAEIFKGLNCEGKNSFRFCAMQAGGDGGIMLYVCAIAMLVLSVAYFYRIMMVKLPGVVRDVLKMNGIKRDDIPKAR